MEAAEKLKNSKPIGKMADFQCQTIQEISIQTIDVASYEHIGTNTTLVGEGQSLTLTLNTFLIWA